MSERWARIGELFDEAVTAPPDQRAAVVERAADPEDIKNEVRSLLAAHDVAGSFLEMPNALPAIGAAAGGPASVGEQLAPGAVVGPYRISGLIGRGGMGIVYDAEDTRLHRRVALKALPQAAAAEPHQRERLRKEARAAAALQHPGIATVYALEEIDGQIFISSEFLEGHTLSEEIRRGPLPPGDVVAAAVDLARALCVAHERGIVHRDLKPENVIRTREGLLKIVDFGLAQFEETASHLFSHTRLTQPGLIVGTPAYMAPEQLLGRETDFRVDHFALGIVLYELCTGTHPFGDGSLPSTIARILAAAPGSPRAHGGVPAALWDVIARCLEKDPAHRFPSTRELVGAFEMLRASGTVAARAPAASNAPGASRTGAASDTRHAQAAPVSTVRWWRFHQFAAAATYWAMVWPVWHVHRSLGRAGLFFFFAVLAAVVVAANLRLHLWFSSRVYPEDLAAQHAEASRWIWWADVSFAILLVAGGIALPEDRAGWAALLISVGVGTTVAFVFIEPATARAAFRHR